jgi:hypothetical protein
MSSKNGSADFDDLDDVRIAVIELTDVKPYKIVKRRGLAHAKRYLLEVPTFPKTFKASLS